MEGGLVAVGVGDGKAALGIPGDFGLVVPDLLGLYVLVLFYGVGDQLAVFITQRHIFDGACPLGYSSFLGTFRSFAALLLVACVLIALFVRIVAFQCQCCRIGCVAGICTCTVVFLLRRIGPGLFGALLLLCRRICHSAVRQGDGLHHCAIGLQIDLDLFRTFLCFIILVLPDLGDLDIGGFLLITVGDGKGVAFLGLFSLADLGLVILYRILGDGVIVLCAVGILHRYPNRSLPVILFIQDKGLELDVTGLQSYHYAFRSLILTFLTLLLLAFLFILLLIFLTLLLLVLLFAFFVSFPLLDDGDLFIFCFIGVGDGEAVTVLGLFHVTDLSRVVLYLDLFHLVLDVFALIVLGGLIPHNGLPAIFLRQIHCRHFLTSVLIL